MGVTIHHRLGQKKKYVKSTLDHAQNLALNIANSQAETVGIKMKIRRESDYCLLVDIGNCETLVFDFKSGKQIEEQGAKGWDYEYSTLTDGGKEKLDAEIYYASAFCKTQFAEKLVEHRWVADITRAVASRCHYAEVHDEGDYYHSGNIEDAAESIGENGALIDSIGATLGGLGHSPMNIVKSGETKIKGRKGKK